MTQLVIAPLIIKNETAKTAYSHGTMQVCYEKDSK